MIEATEMIRKMGKKNFAKFAAGQQHGQRMVDIKRRRRWGTNVKYRKCEHGKWVIDNYVWHPCAKCKETWTKPPDFVPHFNLGLGGWVESKSDMKRVAKQRGLIHVGSDGI